MGVEGGKGVERKADGRGREGDGRGITQSSQRAQRARRRGRGKSPPSKNEDGAPAGKKKMQDQEKADFIALKPLDGEEVSPPKRGFGMTSVGMGMGMDRMGKKRR
jgi:hypothetical protein